jgi:rod shape-determining protein MreD
VRWLRFVVGLLVALTVHAVLNEVAPGFMVFLDPYVILLVFYAMGGHLTGAIVAGVVAGFTQDAFAISIPGLHAFTLTLCGYAVAFVNLRLALNGILAFGGCLLGASLVNELLLFALPAILLPQPGAFHLEMVAARAIVTTLSGMLLFQLLTVVLKREPLESARKARRW